MGLNHHNIHEMLEKFWAGETSLAEEQALKEFFAYNNPPEGSEEMAAYFALLNEQPEVSPAFDEKILAHLEEKQTPVFRMSTFWRVTAVAASIALVASIFIFNDNQTGDIAQIDPEVQEAFEQTKSALFMISTELNEGQDHASRLVKFHDAQATIKTTEQ
jgi:hypothetical protein